MYPTELLDMCLRARAKLHEAVNKIEEALEPDGRATKEQVERALVRIDDAIHALGPGLALVESESKRFVVTPNKAGYSLVDTATNRVALLGNPDQVRVAHPDNPDHPLECGHPAFVPLLRKSFNDDVPETVRFYFIRQEASVIKLLEETRDQVRLGQTEPQLHHVRDRLLARHEEMPAMLTDIPDETPIEDILP